MNTTDTGPRSIREHSNATRPSMISRHALIAVGASLAAHLGVGVYLAVQRYIVEAPAELPSPPIMTTLERWRPLPETKPQEPLKVRQDTVDVHEPSPSLPLQRIEPITAMPDTGAAADSGGPVNLQGDSTAGESATPNQPAETEPLPKLIRNPSWAAKPTSAQMARLYPKRALERGIDGGATLLCEVLSSGSVRNCAVIDEHPRNHGFGTAALASARHFRLHPRTEDGATVEGARVRIPLVFNLAD